jgi:hypothetical protein
MSRYLVDGKISQNQRYAAIAVAKRGHRSAVTFIGV